MFLSSAELFFTSNKSKKKVVPRKWIRDHSNPLDMPEKRFRKLFRLSKETFAELLNDIQYKFSPGGSSQAIPPILKLLAALHFFGSGSYQSTVGNNFNLGMSQPSVSLSITEILNIMEKHLYSKWVSMSVTAKEKEEAKQAFVNLCRLPGVIGAVDVSHVNITSPGKNLRQLYLYRKGQSSLNTLIACDHKKRITFMDALSPGSTPDSSVWKQSDLRKLLQQNYENGDHKTWLLGDAAFPLEPFILTPFQSANEGSPEAIFNRKHSKGRSIIDDTIGLLKARFKCLSGDRQLHYAPPKAAQFIKACCILHNICIERNVDIDIAVRNDVLQTNIETATEPSYKEASIIRRNLTYY